jgi:hypothetical protein
MVVHRMTTSDGDGGGDGLNLSNLSFSDVPTPDHTAGQDDDEGARPLPPLDGKPPPLKRRLLPGAGSRDTSPREQRRTPPPPREHKPLPPIPRNGFAPDIAKLYVMIGLGLMPFDVELASRFTEIAQPAGEAWDELARKNEAVRRILVALLETGAWGKVMAAHAPLVALAVARLSGESVRVSFSASQLGKEAENHANKGHENGA